ncbi:unnamed protein product [Dimorphilus gyrociliatus]|uniref:G-protein coupled receptors family 1 profile domain-containing protein n=1 Tax=Dimorphilus gyrociliatus TaxID=2664684 RepID=A0A7I8W9L4_9ANNE|nr:unnamed protein product [Dimorphilus gyrociliatus]
MSNITNFTVRNMQINQNVTLTYGIISILGFFTNLLSILIIFVNKKLRTPHNMYVVNLFVADIYLSINAFLFLMEEFKIFFVNGLLCRFFAFLTFSPPVAVSFCMVFIACNRYVAILRNSTKITMKTTLICIAIVWNLSLLVSLPQLLHLVPVRLRFSCVCCFVFEDNIPYGIFVTVAVFAVPNIVTCFVYCQIYVTVKRARVKVAVQNSSHLDPKHTKLAVQFIILFVLFNASYMPSMIVMWLDKDDNPISAGVKSTVMILFSLNLITNPVVYFAMNTTAREVLCRRKQSKSCHCIKST